MNKTSIRGLTSPPRVLVAIVLAKLFFFGLSPAHATNLLTNGDFENEPNYGPTATVDVSYAGFVVLTGSQMPGWTIEPGDAVTLHNASGQVTISGNFSVNTDGEGYMGANANFYQDIPSTSGAPYQLDFDWQGWYGDSIPRLNILVEDTTTNAILFNGQYQSDALLTTHHVTATFDGTGDTLQLRVLENPPTGTNDNAYLVDNFSIQAVPEPASFILALSGFAVLLLLALGNRRADNSERPMSGRAHESG
jgi:hypothetical protein